MPEPKAPRVKLYVNYTDAHDNDYQVGPVSRPGLTDDLVFALAHRPGVRALYVSDFRNPRRVLVEPNAAGEYLSETS